MSAQWTNKYAIMRDLSMAQGCVPVDVEGILAAGDKPPAYNIVEETEEEFYQRYCTGDADIAAPDVDLISQMLDMVNSQKPLETEQDSPECISLPFSFKKKDTVKKITKTSNESKMKCEERIGTYVPSARADEYYKKFLERSEMTAYVNEDIWSRTMRKMKEIDERKKHEKELSSQHSPSEPSIHQSPSEAIDRDENQKLDIVRLPQHRHLLTGECVVCKVILKADRNVKRSILNECIVDLPEEVEETLELEV